MYGKVLFFLATVALASAQIPSLGWCPEYVPMANFDMNRFLGIWYEAERYFQLAEVVSRCVMSNYTKSPDGKLRVSNEVTSRITGIKRILEGEIKPAASKAEEGKLYVKYTAVPLTPETHYSVLETDYDNYAVLWSCSGIGPIHTQNTWVMTRQRVAPGTVLQQAYGVLDKYKISKAFFVKTNQEDCVNLTPAPASPELILAAASEANKPETVAAPEPHVRNVPIESADSEEPAGNAKEQLEEEKAPQKVASVPERILKVADMAKDEKPAEPIKEEIPPVETEAKKITEKLAKEKSPEIPKEPKKTSS
ncbi:hypothetical protein KPH14_007793 [Odynerus spinipes]|uniref:Lipocalin/cytosolic fatty-acid binding domain-containing protein n=1 Tax=Odynerus spinipes TaxID=1348599 RepID=A0AAD9VM31_9HYME|nr:hypothetical protein KPH14_007793 [Odynerus spinipes]